MLSTQAKFATAMALVAVAASFSFAQAGNWQVDSDHSTAKLSLASTSNSTPPVDIAIALAAGRVSVDPAGNSDSSLHLSIFPAGQGANLLRPDGSFRSEGLAALATYTLMSFQSKNAATVDANTFAFTGDLTVTQVHRETNVAWSNAYSGPVPTEPVVNTTTREVTFMADLSNLPASPSSEKNVEISVMAVVPRSDLPELLTALREGAWPLAVLDEQCEMPYYIGPSTRDYSGAKCTGTLVDGVPHFDPYYYHLPDNLGTRFDASPAGDRVTIVAHLRLRATGDGKP